MSGFQWCWPGHPGGGVSWYDLLLGLLWFTLVLCIQRASMITNTLSGPGLLRLMAWSHGTDKDPVTARWNVLSSPLVGVTRTRESQGSGGNPKRTTEEAGRILITLPPESSNFPQGPQQAWRQVYHTLLPGMRAFFYSRNMQSFCTALKSPSCKECVKIMKGRHMIPCWYHQA